MADDQQQPPTMQQQSLQTISPKSLQTMKFITAASIGAVLLCLSGLTLTGTVISLIIATPAFILFSPVIVPAGIMMFLITAGFLFSGGCSVLAMAAMAAMAWIYKYMAKHKFGADQFDYARMRIANKAKEYGQIVQQHNSEDVAQES